MEEPIREEEPKPYKMAKLAYEACMDTEALEVCSLKLCVFRHASVSRTYPGTYNRQDPHIPAKLFAPEAYPGQTF